MIKICHLTSVHPRNDNRIFYKECLSLSRAFKKVILVVADGKGNDHIQNVKILDVGFFSSRFARILLAGFKVFIVAIRQRAKIYHFHDPELIFWGFLLRLTGAKVIYDIHEDYVASIKQKEYLSNFIARFTALLFDYYERFFCLFFIKIIAEKYYSYRIKKALEILNYPRNVTFSLNKNELPDILTSNNLLYTGNITLDRGAINHVNILNYNLKVNLYMIGHISHSTYDKLMETVPYHRNRLFILGLNEFVSFETIMKYYNVNNWLAGLAIFPDTEHYNKKELTKFFEYMQSAIPVIYSAFDTWKALIDYPQMGIFVDPGNEDEINNAINYLIKNRKEWEKMSANCRYMGNTYFKWSTQESKLIELYNTILYS